MQLAAYPGRAAGEGGVATQLWQVAPPDLEVLTRPVRLAIVVVVKLFLTS